MARSAAQATANEHWASRHIGLSGRAIRLLREARWIVLCFLAIFLFLILLSYNPVDPGWSHAFTTRQVHNLGGRIGAWFADLILYLFGLSAYLFSFFLMLRVLASYRRLHQEAQLARTLPLADAKPASRGRTVSQSADASEALPPSRFAWERWIGFILLLVGCSALEGSRLYNLSANLPLAPGGLLGALVAGPVHVMLGAVGGTLALLLLIAIGIIFLLKNLGFIDLNFYELLFSWPMILVAIGVVQLVDRSYVSGFILLFLGTVFMLPRLDIIQYDAMRVFWPVVLIVIGTALLFRRRGISYAASAERYRASAASTSPDADVYDALTSVRPYKKAYKPNVVYQMMMHNSPGHFDMDRLRLFFDNVAIYPVGTVMKTNLGYAIVKKVIFGHTLAPVVIVFADKNSGRLLKKPFGINLAHCRRDAIQYVMDDVELLNFIRLTGIDPAVFLDDDLRAMKDYPRMGKHEI